MRVCEVPGCTNEAPGEVCERHGRLAADHAAAVRFIQTTRDVKRLRAQLAHAEARLTPMRDRLANAELELESAADVMRGVE